MMMKKFVALCLMLCLVCGMSAAVADTVIDQDTKDQKAFTTVTYQVNAVNEYIVTIPAEIALTKTETLDGTPSLTGSMDVKVSGDTYNMPNRIFVSVASGNKGYLCLVGAVDVGYPYMLGLNTTSNLIALGGDAQNILTCERADVNNGTTAKLLVNAEFGDWDAGTYEDILTFYVQQEIIGSDID